MAQKYDSNNDNNKRKMHREKATQHIGHPPYGLHLRLGCPGPLTDSIIKIKPYIFIHYFLQKYSIENSNNRTEPPTPPKKIY